MQGMCHAGSWQQVQFDMIDIVCPPLAPSSLLQRAGAVRARAQVRAVHAHCGPGRAGHPVGRQDRPLPPVSGAGCGLGNPGALPRVVCAVVPGSWCDCAAKSNVKKLAAACSSISLLTCSLLMPMHRAGTSAWCASPAARPTFGGAPARPTMRWMSGECSQLVIDLLIA